jgi:hypothetical protein
VPYQAIATVPAEPPWAQMNSFVTEGQELTCTGVLQLCPWLVEYE